MTTPVLFLSHASEDNIIAEKMARDFTANGIKTFYSDWEIGTGDSIVAKVNAGLDACTHFAVLLTPISITKPWVQREMDTGFVQNIEGQCAFLPIRRGLAVSEMPPLLKPLKAPSIDDYTPSMAALIAEIFGVPKAPPLGSAPGYMSSVVAPAGHLSVGATTVGTLLAKRSSIGRPHDTEIDGADLVKQTGLPEATLIAAVEDLEHAGLIDVRRHMGSGRLPLGFASLEATYALFEMFDPTAMGWDTGEDALRIAARLVSDGQGVNAETLRTEFGWEPRRLNPAMQYLKTRDYGLCSQTIDFTYAVPYLFPNPRTGPFVRANSRS